MTKKEAPAHDSRRSAFINEMQQRILSGELKPGDRLPPERELALEMGISRSSANLGLLDLERKGFLHIIPRQGTFVADYRGEATPETLEVIMKYDSTRMDEPLLADMMAFRSLVERDCARLVCGKLTPEQAGTLDDFIEKLRCCAETELVDILFSFHYCLVSLTGNAVYAMMYRSFEAPLRALTEAHFRSVEQLKISLPLYRDLVDAIKTGDQGSADKYMKAIMDVASEYLRTLI